ncbi:MAG: oligosaccharide flippase family protein [Methanomassiliicoccales archaeon]
MAESLARKSLLVTMMNLLGAIIAYAGFFVIARVMPQGEQVIGLVTFSTGFASVFIPISRLGFPNAHVKRVSEGEDLGGCNGAFLLLTAILTAIMSAVVVGSIYFWTVLLHRGFETRTELDAIWIMLGYNVIATIANVPVTTFSARREMVKGQIGAFAGHIVRVAAIVFVVFSRLSGLDIVWCYFVGGAASLGASIYLFRSYPVHTPSRKLLHEYVSFAKPLYLATLLAPLPVSLAPVVVQFYWHLTYTGYFGAAYRIVTVFVVLGASVAAVIFPRISELHSKGDMLAIRNSTREAEKLLAFILAPLTLFLMIYATGIIHVLLSNSFRGAVSSLAVLAVWLYVSGVAQPKNNLIQGINRPREYGLITVSSSVLSVVLLFLLIPSSLSGLHLAGLADVGASLSLVAGAIVIYILSHHYSLKHSGTGFEYGVLIFPAIATVSCLLVYPLTFVMSELTWTWYVGLLFAAIVFALYIALCLALRALDRKELRFLFDTLNPLEMHSYVASELSSKYRE